jgi:hypothetical protein
MEQGGDGGDGGGGAAAASGAVDWAQYPEAAAAVVIYHELIMKIKRILLVYMCVSACAGLRAWGPKGGGEGDNSFGSLRAPSPIQPHTQHTTQHNTTQHNTTQHNTTQHNTTKQRSKMRADVICAMRWEQRRVPKDLPVVHEKAFADAYDRALAAYMGFGSGGIAMDLTTDLHPPKDACVKVRVLRSHGSIALSHSARVPLVKGSVHSMQCSEAEPLIRKGVLQVLDGNR